ncbi:MAG: cache domain-containing protein [Desulfobacter sp.]|nr:cache domain-containing protein [Desulfobacter sp.]
MEKAAVKHNDTMDVFVKKKSVSGVLRILIPLYLTYILFAVCVFLLFIPQQRKQLFAHKKETILQLTDNTVSLLAEYERRIQNGEISSDNARQEAMDHIRTLRYGPGGKDYFWIIDMHPFMVMHPYRPDLEGRPMIGFKDSFGNYPFAAMVETVLQTGSGYVNYYWQFKDFSDRIEPKISYVKGFPAWGWIVGTGVYEEDIHGAIQGITKDFFRIFVGIFVFVLLMSIHMTIQVFHIEKKRHAAEQAKEIEEVRIKKLFELSQLTDASSKDLTAFALEEAVCMTGSQVGYLAFLSEDQSELTMHTWSRRALQECGITERVQVFKVAHSGLWADAARYGKPLVCNDYSSLASGKKGYPAGHPDIRRVLSVPVFDGIKMVALAGVGNKTEEYNDSDTRQLQLMMDGMWKIFQRRIVEEKYQILAQNATDVIWKITLATLKFSYISPSMESLLGFRPDELVGKKMGSCLSQKSLEEVTRVIAEEMALDSEQGLSKHHYRVLELEMVKKDGSKIWSETTARFLRDDNGRPDRILGISRDITQRKELEKKLRQSNAGLRLAQKIAKVGNWFMDSKARMPVWSSEVYEIHERDPGDGPFRLEAYQNMYRNKWWTLFQDSLEAAIHQGVPYNIEVRLVLPSGKIKWVNIICEPEARPDSNLYDLYGTIQDVTARKNLEAHVQQAQKMEALGTLASGIAHDFNNILSSMIGFTELAKLRLKKDPDTLEKLDHVLAGGIRARDLVKHIQTFSRKSEVQKELTQISPLVKECMMFISASIPSEIEVRQEISNEEIFVFADPTQIHQVMMNFLTNTVYAMKETGGVLKVKYHSLDISENDELKFKELNPGKYVQISISDTGSGIPKEMMEKIFEPFFTTKIRGEGTGMGLSTAYGIIKSLGGEIQVHSSPGTGTCFNILIPEHKGDIREKRSTPLMENGQGRILVVDDETVIVEATSQMLENMGYQVAGMTRGADALEAFSQEPFEFDLVLTDLSMPGITGLHLSEQIKAVRPDIPVILCTGFSEGVTPEMLKTAGIADMVMKPMISSELSQAIKNNLNRKTP